MTYWRVPRAAARASASSAKRLRTAMKARAARAVLRFCFDGASVILRVASGPMIGDGDRILEHSRRRVEQLMRGAAHRDAHRGPAWFGLLHVSSLSEGLRPSDSPTRALRYCRATRIDEMQSLKLFLSQGPGRSCRFGVSAVTTMLAPL